MRGVPLLNFEGGPGAPLLNSEGSPGVSLLNFRGVPGSTFKFYGGPRSWVPGSRGPRSRGPDPILHHAILNRCYFLNEISDPVDTTSLHGFSDASELAYGAYIYIKSIQRSGNVSVNLVTSKSRVTPIKKRYSIPRLELLGTFILSKLMVTVLNSLTVEIFINEFSCYSDSQIALAWILSIDKKLKTFCQNCVDVIRKNIDIRKWFYMKSSENPLKLLHDLIIIH